ncbi:MAG: 50S ribosomal protein L24 [Candidatus Micrarchaeota archaeon]
MKADTERRKYHKAKIHERKNALHVHLSKELRKKVKQKKRALGIRKGDAVKIMRGSNAGKDGKILSVSVTERLVYLEGFTRRNARGKEIPISFQPSNLMLTALEPSEERKALFSAEAFKVEKPKEVKAEKPVEAKAPETKVAVTVKPAEAKAPDAAKVAVAAKPVEAKAPAEAKVAPAVKAPETKAVVTTAITAPAEKMQQAAKKPVEKKGE